MIIKIALIVVGLLLAVLAVAFFTPGRSPLPASATPKQWVFFVDTSGSVTGEQSLHWQEMADKAMGRFKPGDSLTIYELNDRTLENSAIFSRGLEPFTGGADDLIKKRRLAEQIKKEAREEMRKLLAASKRSISSAVFDGIDRVKLDPHRRTVVVWLSDMLNSSEQDPNLEKVALTTVNFADAITDLARRHQWHSGTLAQADVHVILPSAGAAKPLNDRRMVKQFFTVLFQSLGANLITFDTAYSAKLS